MKNDESRKDVAQAMNSEMLVFDIKNFLEHYGPSPEIEITPDAIAGCKEYLLERQILENQTDGEEDIWSWTGFPTAPAKSTKTEPEVFDPLKDIVKGIWDYADEVQEKKKHRYKFKMVPKNHIESSISGANHMMDACILEQAYKDKLVNNKVVMPFEMKKKWTEADQIQVRSSIYHSPATPDHFIGSRTSGW